MKSCLVFIASLWSMLAAPLVQANIVGLDLQNFNPAPSSVDGVTVSNALTLGQGHWSLGLFVNYATNTLPYFRNEEGQTRDLQKKFNDSISTLDLQAAYGVTSFWDLQVSVPYLIGQQLREDEETHGFYSREGLTGFRVGTKLRLLQVGPFAVGVLGNASYNLVEGNPYTGTSIWPNSSLELATSLNFDALLLTANAGYRWRFTKPASEITNILPIERYGDQLIYSLGAVIPISSRWALTGELYGAVNSDEFSEVSARATSIAEALGGLRYHLRPELQLEAGLGGELRHSVSSPDARVYAGIRWTLGEPKAAPAPVPPATPPTQALVPPQPDISIDLDEVYFPFGSVEIRDPHGFEVLEKLTKIMQQHSDIEKVLIEGHTCDIGTEQYNQILSDHRALSVERWLSHRYGIASQKLHSIGWGETQPKVENNSNLHRRLNRRVSFKIFFKNEVNRKAYTAQ